MDYTDFPESIEIPVWVKRGMYLVRREYLSFDDPDHPYNYVQKKLGIAHPELYGLNNPRGCSLCGRNCNCSNEVGINEEGIPVLPDGTPL